MTTHGEQLPRIFQANIARLYQRVIQPCLEQLPVHDRLTTGEAPTLDAFLDRAAAQVDNYTANEANKVFALMLTAVFERQLRTWAPHILETGQQKDIVRMTIEPLFAAVTEARAIDLVQRGLGQTLAEAFLIANVVRHGDGRSSVALRAQAAHLWDQQGDYIDLAPGPSPDSEMLRVRAADLLRYVRAMVRYWGLADRQPFAVTDGPV